MDTNNRLSLDSIFTPEVMSGKTQERPSLDSIFSSTPKVSTTPETPQNPNNPNDLQGRIASEQTAGVNKIKQSEETGGGDIIKGFQQTNNARNIKDVAQGGGNIIKGAAESGFGTISGAGQAALAPVTAIASPIISAAIPKAVEAIKISHPILGQIIDKISPTIQGKVVPQIQQLIKNHPDAANLTGDILNTALMAVGGGEIEPALKESLGNSLTKDSLGVAKENITSGADIKNAGTAIKDTAENTVTNAKNIKSNIVDKLAGNEANLKASRIEHPQTQEFIQGKKTMQNVVDKTQKAIDQFKEKSMKGLNSVKSKVTGTNFNSKDVADTVNEKMMSALGQKVEQRGTQGFDLSNSSVKDLVNNGILNEKESTLINGMINKIKNTPDMSDRGILNLKEDLYKLYYKAGNQDYNASNKVVKNIYDGLNEMVASKNPKLKSALDKASENISTSKKMEEQLLGGGTEREAKLKSIASNLKNPAINQDDMALVKRLEKETGIKITSDLEGYSNFKGLIDEYQKTGKFPTAKDIKTKAAVEKLKNALKIIGGIGGTGFTGYEIAKHL